MADVPISGLAAAVAVLAADDLIPYVDASDTSQAPTGTTKKMTTTLFFTSPAVTGSVTITGGTVTTSAPVINATQTWNDGAQIFTAVKVNVTDTASDATSLLLDLKVGGVSKATISKAGALVLADTITSGAVNVGAITATSAVLSATGVFLQRSGSTNSAVYANILNTQVNGRLGCESTTGAGIFTGSTADVFAFGTVTNHSVQICTNNTLALTVTGAQLFNFAGRVGIGASPATSALLELSSTTGALLLSRMTTTQRDALTPVDGMVIYNTSLGKIQGREGGGWVSFV